MYKLQFDGGTRLTEKNKPGGAGAVIFDDKGKIVVKKGKYIEGTTNNFCEYSALILGLSTALDMGIRRLQVKGDSELVVKQVKGEYKVKNAILKELHTQVIKLMKEFDEISISHVYREYNKEADALADLCILMKKDYDERL